MDIKLNESYIIEITDIGHSGEGIGKIDGLAVFVEETVIGDKVNIEITTLKKNYAIGKVKEYLSFSPLRTKPHCDISDLCGGCQLQNMEYTEQLKIKKKLVVDSLERIGGLADIKVHDCIGMDLPERYRNKAQFPVKEENGEIKIGFYQKKSHDIVQCDTCMIQHEINDKIIKEMKDIIKKYSIPVYDENTGKGLIRHIVTRTGTNSSEIMLILVTNGVHFPEKENIIREIKDRLPEVTTSVQNINTKRSNVILGDISKTLYGKGYITDSIGELKFEISPLSFYQVNPMQMEKLYNKALEYAGLKGNETVFDLYCGIGTISLFLAHKSKKVIGVEIVQAAVEDARRNAEINGIENAEFFAGKAEEVVPKLYKEGYKADVVVVDPPRKGCDEVLLDTIAKMLPERIVYVSCNPSTLARDLKYLEAKGYQTIEVQPLDMFPMTTHVECVTLMSRVEE